MSIKKPVIDTSPIGNPNEPSTAASAPNLSFTYEDGAEDTRETHKDEMDMENDKEEDNGDDTLETLHALEFNIHEIDLTNESLISSLLQKTGKPISPIPSKASKSF